MCSINATGKFSIRLDTYYIRLVAIFQDTGTDIYLLNTNIIFKYRYI